MLSINGVSYMDTQAFANEVRLVVDGDYERVFSALTDWALLGQPADEDAYASLVFGNPVRRPRDEERRNRQPGGRKNKENK